MQINIKQEITVDDLLQNTQWHGETDEDNQSVENLQNLNILVTDLIRTIYLQHQDIKWIAENKGADKAKRISYETKSILINAVKMATDEEDWDIVDKLFDKEKENNTEV